MHSQIRRICQLTESELRVVSPPPTNRETLGGKNQSRTDSNIMRFQFRPVSKETDHDELNEGEKKDGFRWQTSKLQRRT